MVEYLEKFPPFGTWQRPPYNKILDLVEFSLPKEWQKELIIQGFDSVTQGLTELVEFFERLDTAEEIFQTQGDGNNKNQQKRSPVNATNPPSQRRAKVQTGP